MSNILKLPETKFSNLSFEDHEQEIEDEALIECKNTPSNSKSDKLRINKVKTKLGPRHSRSMYVPIQKTFYGPKATLKEVSDDYLMLIQDPISMQLKWRQTPTNVFVIKKECDSVFESFNEFVNYLTNVSAFFF